MKGKLPVCVVSLAFILFQNSAVAEKFDGAAHDPLPAGQGQIEAVISASLEECTSFEEAATTETVTLLSSETPATTMLQNQVNYLLDNHWSVGEKPVSASATSPPVDDEAMNFVKGSLALGLLASYYRTAGRDSQDGNVIGYAPLSTDFALNLCLTYWLSNNLIFTPGLFYSHSSSVQRINENDRYGQATNLYGIMLGAGYFKPCFGQFGLLTGADLSFGIGNNIDKSTIGNDETKTKSSLWQMEAAGYFGVWYAVNRYLITGQLGLIAYRYTSAKIEGDFTGNYRQNENEFLVGLNTKQFLLGMRYLLNRNSSSTE